MIFYELFGTSWYFRTAMGVRRYQNKDGTLTEAGKKRIAEKFMKNAAGKTPDNSLESYGYMRASGFNGKHISRMKDATSKYAKEYEDACNAIGELSQDFYKHEDYYRGVSMCINTMNGYWAGKATINDLSMNLAWGMFDDGDQGSICGESVYVQMNGLKDSLEHERQRKQDAYKNMKNSAKSVVSDILGEYGNTPISGDTSLSDSIASKIASGYSNYYWNNTDTLWGGTDWERGVNPTTSIKEGQKLFQNYMNANGSGGFGKRDIMDSFDSGWQVTNLAAERLGISSKPISQYTQSDWDRIAEESANIRAGA